MDAKTETLLEEAQDWLKHDTSDSLASDLILKMSREIERLTDDLEEVEQDKENLSERIDENDAELVEAIDAILDGVERPVGTLRPVLPDTPANQRALVALHDAISRNL